MGVLDSDGVTPIPLKIDPITGYLLAVVSSDSDVTTKRIGNAKHDPNYVPTMLAVDDDGVVCKIIMNPSNNAVYASITVI